MTVTDTLLTSPETFWLGDFAFRLASRSRQLLDDARRLYSGTVCDGQHRVFDLDRIEARVIESQYATIFHSLITEAYRYHDGHLYIDACALLTDRRELVLLAGASHAGKTTLTVAAAQKLGWKIVSEDLVLIAPSLNRIVPFVHPLSIRPSAPLMIADATGLPPVSLYLDRWLHCHEMFYTGACVTPQFSCAILLNSDSHQSGFSSTSIQPHELIRELLPLSNALNMDNGTELLYSGLEKAQCSIIRGGTVRQRLEFLAELRSKAVAAELR